MVVLSAGAASAWETHLAPDGQPQRWAFTGAQPLVVRLVDPPPGLRLRTGGDLRLAVTQAAQAWQAVESAHVPVRFAGQIHPRPEQPVELLVQFDTGAEFPGGHNAAGFTAFTLRGHDIVSALIHLNAADFDWATDGSTAALDVQSIVEHELGHALGLAHPCGDLDTQTPSCNTLAPAVRRELEADVMFASITPGPHRLLSQDDRDGITALQPAPAPPEITPELTALAPSCLEETQQLGPGLSRNVTVLVGRAPDPAVLELLSGDQLIAEAALGRDGKGSLIAVVPAEAFRRQASLDARLVARSGKAGVLFDALDIRASCSRRGCSSGGAGVLALFPALLFLWRRKSKSTPRRREGREDSRRKAFGFQKNHLRGPLRPLRLRGALLLLLFFSFPAFAYKRSTVSNNGSVELWWSTRGHPFQIDALGTPDVPGGAAFTAIRKSFLTWASVGCSDLAFPDQGLSQNAGDRVVGYFPGQYNRNLVLFRTRRCGNGKNGGVVPAGDPCLSPPFGCGNVYDCWDDHSHGEGVIATTTTTSNRFTGQINDSDIEINNATGSDGTRFTFTAVDGPPCGDANQTGCVRLDIQNTITHEAGHTIGLDHATDPNATMYASAPEGETSKRVLGTDDIQGICDIYPRGAPTVTGNDDPLKLTVVGSSNGGCGCSQAQTGPGAALGALALFLWRRRRATIVRIEAGSGNL